MPSVAVHDNSAPLVPDFSADRIEFGTLVTDCGLFDPGDRARISLTGGDRVRWLNGMITNNVRDLPAGQGVYAFLLNPQGHILGDLYAYNRGAVLLVDIEQSQREKILATFDRYIIMDDVEVADITGQQTAIGVAGPKAAGMLRALGLAVPELKPLQFADLVWRNEALLIGRGDNPAVDSYQLWLPAEGKTAIREALGNAGAKPVGAGAWELLRVAAGLPRYGQDIRERDLPQETEQQRALHFNKGCYIGQEIVERIRSRGAVHRKFTGFEVQGALPALGTKVQAEGKDVGEVTSTATLPAAGGELPVALGYVRREFAVPGKQVQAGDARLSVASLPFTRIFPSKD